MNKDITDLPATSPLFLSHLVDTYGGSIEIQSKAQSSNSPKRQAFSSHEGSHGAATNLSLNHFIQHKKPAKTEKMVVY